MAGRDEIRAPFGKCLFLMHAGQPGQRPTYEDSNGLLRQHSIQTSHLRAYSRCGSSARFRSRSRPDPRKALQWPTRGQILAAAIASP